MLRVIQEIKPAWIVAENVRGIVSQGGGLVFERVCAEMEANGYEVQPICIPATSVGAWHLRYRIFIIAHSKGKQSSDLHTCLNGQGQGEYGGMDSRKGMGDLNITAKDEHRFGIGEQNESPLNQWNSEPRVDRVVYGTAHRVDRASRLRALGNAVVPQQVYPIYRAIVEVEAGNKVKPPVIGRGL